jgi:hypothetical protein
MNYKTNITLLLATAAVVFMGCTDQLDLKGRVRLSISGTLMDDPAITGVNLIVTGVEAKRDGTWRSLRGFDQPVGVNLLELQGGSSFILIDQFIDPGLYTEFRVSVLMADPRSAVLRSPVSTVDFKSGESRSIQISGGANSFTFPGEMNVSERTVADYNLMVDVRKSIIPAASQAFSFVPEVRVVNVNDTGGLSGRLTNVAAEEDLRVFVYKAGTFALSEAELKNGIRFGQAVDAASVSVKRFQVGFLPEGSYDLVFVRLDETGRFAAIRGVARKLEVAVRQTTVRDIDMKALSDS